CITLIVAVITSPWAAADTPPKPAIGSVFVIALENHNLTQPINLWGKQQILGNPAAPYMNSLITTGNPNAAQTSYARAYYNVGVHTHPSEPNYIWSEAGTSFGVHTDADPSAAAGNAFKGVDHLTGLLNRAGIAWKNYQEDIQYTQSPTRSACKKGKTKNIYNGTYWYCYVAKHNPMAFFSDTATQNVYPLARLFEDLKDNTVGRYNWITPNEHNEAHTAPRGGFTYHGRHYTGDQAAVASADHFLSIAIPKIMASRAYQANGVIILWWDETAGADDTHHPLPEIVISPLAKGNAYASTVPMSHASDLKTMLEIFRLPALHYPIPKDETNVFGNGYNDMESANDLSDLFVPGVIPSTFGPAAASDR
ncbi:MAG TPA: alkaline phosphatase family protein, partial [Pseudomonadales bacterium]|nr:alkaline phosphatase family protein [Pseudomonadales bacterium]